MQNHKDTQKQVACPSKVMNADRPGGFSVPHHANYEDAWAFYDLYCEAIEECKAGYESLLKKYADNEYQKSQIIIEMKPKISQCERLANASHLFACLTVEGLLNHYGILRLGNKFYTENLEMMSIFSKATTLVAICKGTLIYKGNKLYEDIKYLRDIRNKLVHPKSAEVSYLPGTDQMFKELSKDKRRDPVESLKRLNRILNELSKLDPGFKEALPPHIRKL